jgi:iron complex outermembrane recepter protein
MFKRTSISTGVLLALGGALSLPAIAQTQDTQRIEITGSAIKRTSAEGPSPVEVITRKDIARTGASSVNELLRSIPSVDIFDQGELSSNSPAGSGTASVRLRGLSDSEVLVLLNGRRLPLNALYDSSGAGAAFDINSLPIGAIEQIQILKDGASAIYGADAVAGVINFITKTDYQGIEGTFNFGSSSRGDGEEKRVGFSAGFGDLSKDRFNVLVGIDYFKRDPIFRKDRELTRSVNFTRFGGLDSRSSFAPTGNVINPNSGAFVRLPYKTCPPENLQTSLNRCRYDFNASVLTAYNGADRLSALTVATVQVAPNLKAFAEATFSTSKDTFRAHPVPDFFVLPIIDEAQRPWEILDANGNGTDTVYVAGRFMQGGPRTTNRKSDFFNIATGVDGTFGNYDWKVHLSRGTSKVTNSDSNYYDANKWLAATSGGLLDPTVNTNDPAFVESLKVRPVRKGESVLTTLNAQLNGELAKLPAGPLQFAVGLNANRESLDDEPDALTQAGQVIGSIAQAAVSARRSYKAVFAELAVPITKTIEGQLAVRHDKYPNTSATSPKVAAKWSITPEFAVRGSFTRSFRAPVLKQLFGAREEGAVNITDPDLCKILGVTVNVDPVTGEETCDLAAFQVNGSNPNLQPEKGKTINLGVVFEASRNVSASVDLWRINKTNDISSPTIATAIESGLFQKVGARFDIFTNLQNIAERETAGVDVDFRVRLPGTAFGNVAIRNLVTYYRTNKTRQVGEDWAEFNGTYATPRFRNGLSITAEKGPWTVGTSLRTTGGFWDTDQSFPVASNVRRVSAHEELDLSVQYAGFKNFEISGGIKNALDNMPPFSLQNASDNQYSQMGFAELYTSRGRFFYVSAKYTFR